ncbi:MAG: 23S rRNA (guanosine(2251)-2'-O)-methyltransferase RlmB [Clostridia bacterium]|nr:23S rRNA (guanosine(2251)-2'-O)-methyltransferase RlmB [Clostridia bacterium]
MPEQYKNKNTFQKNRGGGGKSYDRCPPLPKREFSERELPENMTVGRNAVKELLASGRDIDKIFVQNGEREGSINLLIGQAKERKITIVEVERVKLDEMTGHAAHQGIVVMAAERDYSTVEDILAYAEEKGEKPFIVLCDGVEDPHNLGAIIRSAECCGVHGIIIPKRRSVGLTSVVGKSSAGAIEHMRIAKVTNLSQTIDELKERGIWFYAADMGGEPAYKTDLKGAIGIVLGSEGEGISRLVKEKCDFTVSIPLYGNVNSMNVSCAGAVLFYEAAKQRH